MCWPCEDAISATAEVHSPDHVVSGQRCDQMDTNSWSSHHQAQTDRQRDRQTDGHLSHCACTFVLWYML